MSSLSRLIVLVTVVGAAPGAAAEPVAEPLPSGIWELAATHKAPSDMRVLEPLAGVLVMSDLTGSVAAIRPDSGLVVWTRRVPTVEVMSGVWPLATGDGGIVLAGGDSLHAFRADVGSRLWERDLGCQSNGCQIRVVYAAVPAGGKEPLLFLATGGIVQSELVRLDPLTGAPLWRRAALVQHPRRVLASPELLICEDALEPYTVRFFDPADGHVLGAWQPSIGGVAKPVSDLIQLPDGRTLAIDLRPSDGLAGVTVLSTTGNEITERQVPRPPQITNAPVIDALLDDGLALFTPDPTNGVAYVTTLLLAAPWTARTEQVRSWAEPLRVGGRWAFPPSVRAPGAVWSVSGTGRWAREISGIDPGPPRTRTFVAGARLVLVDLGDAKAKSQGLVTIDGASGRLHGFGAPDLGAGTIDRVLALGDELILTRGKQLFRIALVPWADAVAKLRTTRAEGIDIQPFLQRLARFGAAAKALADAVRSGTPDRPAPSSGPLDPGTQPPGDAPPPSAPELALSPEDQALVKALRQTWFANPLDTLLGMRALIEQAPEHSPRRRALHEAFATLLLDLVLAPGVVPRGVGGAASLVALARSFEWEAQAFPPSRTAAAIYAGLMALLDESLVGADLLARALPSAGGASDPLLAEARLELARRSLLLLRKSAGPLRSDTSRQMLVSGLRFFKHSEALLGAELAAVSELFDRVVAKDIEATRLLVSALVRAEGPRASQRGAGPALCQLACEATLAVCGEGVSGALVGCQSRCERLGAVRLVNPGRPTADPRWFCHP